MVALTASTDVLAGVITDAGVAMELQQVGYFVEKARGTKASAKSYLKGLVDLTGTSNAVG